jgi:predicted ATPase
MIMQHETARVPAALERLVARRYLSLRDVDLRLERLNALIGANASGKSNLLDAMELLSDAVRAGDFDLAVRDRGGLVHLAWKGEKAQTVELAASVRVAGSVFRWTVRLALAGASFSVEEDVHEQPVEGGPPRQWLHASAGAGFWWSKQGEVSLAIRPTGCALAAAAADEAFPARALAQFVSSWGFFDPSSESLRMAAVTTDSARLARSGRNLAARLNALRESGSPAYDRILTAARAVLGLPDELDFRVSDADRVHFTQSEPGLVFRVHQIGASSGTLRTLALMTALFGEDQGLVAVEEPESHVHPAAIQAFAECVRRASEAQQIVLTTHSPVLLDALGEPGAVCVVRRSKDGTTVNRESNPAAVRKALEESGFGLGELLVTKGFGT